MQGVDADGGGIISISDTLVSVPGTMAAVVVQVAEAIGGGAGGAIGPIAA